jgi:hypothetical protein
MMFMGGTARPLALNCSWRSRSRERFLGELSGECNTIRRFKFATVRQTNKELNP